MNIQQQSNAAKPDRTGNPAIVLVVEDDDDLREEIASFLGEAGHIVFTARDGAEAMKTLSDTRPALIITDLMMPGVNGWEFLYELDHRPELAEIPRVVITAAGNVGTVPAYCPVFVKPLRLRDLLGAVRVYAGRRPA